jgi:acetyl/propionyl-CoA carboxylase alpha subunit
LLQSDHFFVELKKITLVEMKPCTKVLIANRGEVVSRVARTCREMGVATVGIFSEVDANLPYVRDVDESVCVGPAPSAQSYLDMNKIIAAAKKHGCDAVHPGWGFLSERADFAEAVCKAGLLWIGEDKKLEKDEVLTVCCLNRSSS